MYEVWDKESYASYNQLDVVKFDNKTWIALYKHIQRYSTWIKSTSNTCNGPFYLWRLVINKFNYTNVENFGLISPKTKIIYLAWVFTPLMLSLTHNPNE